MGFFAMADSAYPLAGFGLGVLLGIILLYNNETICKEKGLCHKSL